MEMTALTAPNHQPTAMPQPAPGSRFEGMPYLQCLGSLENAFPALKSFLRNFPDKKDHDREVVEKHYQTKHQREAGRCSCLIFEKSSVSAVEKNGFESSDTLKKYLERNPARESRETKKHRRLFILEDMVPEYVDVLGHHLGVDPLVFSEQTNTWNFTDSVSIPHRGLPSMSVPEQSFTLRYYELRTLFDPKSVDTLSLQMTFAVNKRRYERWRDIDVPSAGKPDRRHAFVRRCASFWTSQDPTKDIDPAKDDLGWDAVIMVDAAFVATCREPQATSGDTVPSTSVPVGQVPSMTTMNKKPPSPSNGSQRMSSATSSTAASAMPPASTRNTPASIPWNGIPRVTNAGTKPTATPFTVTNEGLEECLILKNPTRYRNRASLWKAQELHNFQGLEATSHKSWPYHHGCSTLAPLMFSQVGIGASAAEIQKLQNKRDLVSPLDEMVFYWTQLATQDLIQQTHAKSSNAAYYLLKHTAQHWVNQLELINTTIAKAEWFADDYQAQIDDNLSLQKWKSDLIKVNEIARDINYMRRHLNHFWRALILNLERLGMQLGAESVDDQASLAVRGAQKDFLTIHTRMQPLRDRAEALNSVSNDLANLRAAFRGVHDSEFGLRLSLFASVVFPLTLVASIFSMGDDYRPGEPQFWKLWAIGPPLCAALALGLIYGRRPWRLFGDLRGYLVAWFEHYGSEDAKAYKRERGETKEKKKRDRKVKKAKGTKKDEEHGEEDN